MNYTEPVEEKLTQWHNPLAVEQHVDLFVGGERRPTRYRWKPNETRALPSRFDRAIHTVHNGVIIGGLAPQLVNLGSGDKLDAALDTEAVAKRQAEIEAAAATVARKAADDALIAAAAKKADAEAAETAKAEAAKKAEEAAPLPPEVRSRSRGS